MNKAKLAHAITLALTGAALLGAASSAAAANITMYNTFTVESGGDLGHNNSTDGWTRVYDGSDPDTIATGPESQGNKGTIVPWVGTAGGALPFSYTGSSSLNWAAELENCGKLEISRADSIARYSAELATAGLANGAEIDTGAGAWQDNSATPTGWKHQTDIGQIKSSINLTITLTVARVDSPSSPGLVNDNFGITIFDGQDTNVGNYSHHGSWNCPGCATPRPFTNSNPFGTAGLNFLAYSDTVDMVNGLTFQAKAGHVYSVYLGGKGVGQWSQNVSDYALTITAVPEPATLGLFSVALAGMGAVRRHPAKPGTLA